MATPSTDQDPATGEVEKHLPPRPSQPRRTGRTRAPVSTPRPDNWADMSQVQRKSWLRKQRIRSNSSRRLRVLLGRDGSVDEASTSPAAAAATGSSLATVPGSYIFSVVSLTLTTIVSCSKVADASTLFWLPVCGLTQGRERTPYCSATCPHQSNYSIPKSFAHCLSRQATTNYQAGWTE